MDTAQHTFPIPEFETHKLDDIREELPGKAVAYVSDNAWMLIGLSALGGCLLGFLWPKNKSMLRKARRS